jgi:hypothetical protein
VDWQPRGSAAGKVRHAVPSLLPLTVGMLCDNIERVPPGGLVGMPDEPRAAITHMLCQRRLLAADAVRLFTEGTPADVLLPDCARLNEVELKAALVTCATPRLQVRACPPSPHLSAGCVLQQPSYCAAALRGGPMSQPAAVHPHTQPPGEHLAAASRPPQLSGAPHVLGTGLREHGPTRVAPWPSQLSRRRSVKP